MNVPPLLTSGSLSPLRTDLLRGRSVSSNADPAGCTAVGSAVTNSYADSASAAVVAEGACIDPSAVVHAELAVFNVGAFSVISAGAVLRPPLRLYANQNTAYPEARVAIGSFVYVGPQVVCEAAAVGHMVRIDEQCVVSAGAQLPDGVWLLPRTWVPPEATLSPYTVYSGVPAAPISKLNAQPHQLMHMEFMRRVRPSN